MEKFQKNKFYFVVGAASIVYGILKLYDKATGSDELEADDEDYWEPVDDNTDYQSGSVWDNERNF